VTSQSHKARDPRFETLTKSTSQESSRKAYKFIEDYQRDEIALLKSQIRQSKDEYEREKLTKALQSLQSRKESREAKDRASDVLKARKRDEKEKVKLGKRPFYLKKSNLLIWLVR
jgi:ribosomal RNA-processing protein 36